MEPYILALVHDPYFWIGGAILLTVFFSLGSTR